MLIPQPNPFMLGRTRCVVPLVYNRVNFSRMYFLLNVVTNLKDVRVQFGLLLNKISDMTRFVSVQSSPRLLLPFITSFTFCCCSDPILLVD